MLIRHISNLMNAFSKLLYSVFSVNPSNSVTLANTKTGKLNVGIRGNTDVSAKKNTKNIIIKSKSADLVNTSQMELDWPDGEGYSTNGVFDEITGIGFTSQTTLNIPARVVFTFDDGWASVYNLAYPIMKTAGIVGTVYIVPTLLDTTNYMTSAQVQELYDNGWCIASHTYTHPDMTSYTYAQTYTELQNWITWAQGKGYNTGLKHIAFPNGGYNSEVLRACTDLGLVTARIVGHALNSGFSMYGNPPQLLTPITCGLGSDSPNATAVEANIVIAQAQNKVVVCMMHRIVPSAGYNGDSVVDGMDFVTSELQSLITYCVSNSILTQTIAQFYNSLQTAIHAIVDVQKTLEFNTNYQFIKRCDKIILDGAPAWTAPVIFQTNVYRAYITGWATTHADVSTAVGSNHVNFNDLQEFLTVDAINGALSNHYQVAVHTNGTLYISVDKTYADANGIITGGTNAGLKAWLNAHPITMIYQKLAPTTQSITTTITTNSLSDMSLRSWGDGTIITTEPVVPGDTTTSIPVLVETHPT